MNIKYIVCLAITFHALHCSGQDIAQIFNQANQYFKAQQYEDAHTCYQQVVAACPNSVPVNYNLAIVLTKLNQHAQAIKHYKHALTLQPNNAQIWQYLGHAHAQLHNFEDAINAYETYLSYEPSSFLIRSIVADLLNQTSQFERALNHYRTLAQGDECTADVYYCMGRTLRMLDRHDEALIFFNHALELQPEHPQANLARARLHLLRGNFAHGWPEHECFLQNSAPFDHTPLSTKNLLGQTWMFGCAGGFGDIFQFIRYAQKAKEYGATTAIHAPPALKPIISLCPYFDYVVCTGDQVPHYTRYCVLTSLPLVFNNTTEQDIPQRIPYLFADEELVTHWKNKLSHDHNFKIGICWQPSKYNDELHRLPAEYRNVPLNILSQMSAVPNISLYSLQKNDDANQLDTTSCAVPITTFPDLDESHGAFMDTAALIRNLDLIITTDTAVAHLAGGLGCNVWLLLPYHADWRWLLDRSDTPWYPTMRLFRQPKPGDWQSVVSCVTHQLEKRMTHEKNTDNHLRTQRESLDTYN